MQKALSLFFAAIAILFFGISILFNPNGASEIVEHTIKNNSKIEAVLLEGASFVENYKTENSVLPTRNEYKTWASMQQPSRSYSIRSPSLITNPVDIESRLQDPYIQRTGIGVPPRNSYIIEIWRGEWSEYYISWMQTTTLTSNPADYFLLGRVLYDFFLYVILFFISALASILLWRRSSRL